MPQYLQTLIPEKIGEKLVLKDHGQEILTIFIQCDLG